MSTPARVFYDLPTWTPLYGEPPHAFHGCTSVGFLCRAPEGVLATLVPAPLEALGDVFHVGWLLADEVDAKGATPHRDVHVVEFGIPVSYDGTVGGHCTLEYIDDDMGMAVGRELWAWPKKMGAFVWEERDGGLHLECHRKGHLIIDADFSEADGDEGGAAWPDIFGVRDDAPYLQVRQVPATAGAPARAEVISVDVSEGTTYETRPGTGTLRLHDGPQDALSILGPVEVIGARSDRLDFLFPYGEVIGSVDVD
ncbi:acetoacetate decarboxylase family protein [Capillimicrobium parvum]|uniref:Acetoacetate decarboxylase n=1 Tax=Capillimicrobium parvum TaxID=2884022 RepID=A0A9E6XY08_9ACTN|nr:acetoacetate decarboxylase family protein [Capillimicrobium parvum]UGS36476.1 acetoacetate decarboxylase [Capillimicrobium parvum]